MSQHTPGPWQVVNNRFTSHPTCIGAGDYGAIADTSGFRGIPAEDNANARLIAKAPEMYALICRIAQEWPDVAEAMTARALLREIEGP